MADNIQVRDASGALLTMRTADSSGVHTPYQRVLGYDATDDTLRVKITPSSTVGASAFHHLISTASTNATSVKSSAGTINDITLSNAGASVRYFKLYNKASAPTVGTDTPVRTVLIPPNATVNITGAPAGLRLSTGIAFAITGGIAVADATAVGLSEVAVGMSYT